MNIKDLTGFRRVLVNQVGFYETCQVWRRKNLSGYLYSSLIYLWLFGIGELIVLFIFRDKLKLEHPIAWLYFITLIVNALAAFIGVFDYLRLRPSNNNKLSGSTSFSRKPHRTGARRKCRDGVFLSPKYWADTKNASFS